MTSPFLLKQKLAACRLEALENGALEPIATQEHRAVDGGITFVIRVVSSLARKEERHAHAARERGRRERENPFLPYDPRLFVTDISSTHLGLLNKFPVVDDHLLVVTRKFVEQRSPLDETDFDALARCLGEIDGLAFYNAGKTAGASQRHRHLQLVPLPLAVEARADSTDVPIEPALELERFHDRAGESSRLPFAHAVVALRSTGTSPTGAELVGAYHGVREQLAIDRATPFNLVVTRRFMLLVPREREHAEGVSINALGFAGALLVRNADQLAALRRRGPLRALTEVAGRRPAATPDPRLRRT